MLETAKRETEARNRKGCWVEAAGWSKRMLAALDNGVQAGDKEIAFFAAQGLFMMDRAHALASQSR